MSTKQDSGPLSGKQTILLMDTEKTVLEMCQLLLESLGYTVRAALTPESAIGYLAAEPDFFDLVITDMSLMEVNNGESSLIIEKIRPDLPVILHSAAMGPAYQPGSLRQVIRRPASIPDLAAVVRSVLAAKERPPSDPPPSVFPHKHFVLRQDCHSPHRHACLDRANLNI